MQKRPVESEANETRSETDKGGVQTRLTAEQFRKTFPVAGLQYSNGEIDLDRLDEFAEAFRDKSEAGLRAKLSDLTLKWNSSLKGEDEALRGWRAAEAEVAALRERERWIPVEDKLPGDELVMTFGKSSYSDQVTNYEVARYLHNCRVWTCSHLAKVTHWKALYAAPERGKETK